MNNPDTDTFLGTVFVVYLVLWSLLLLPRVWHFIMTGS